MMLNFGKTDRRIGLGFLERNLFRQAELITKDSAEAPKKRILFGMGYASF